jgi:flagellar biosynthesis/type III secretory pathway M-ring protein FliF/YscJ
MAAWVWIVIAIVALIVVALLLFVGKRERTRRIGRKRGEARALREEALVRTRRADEREAVAREQSEKAMHERVAATESARRAESIDPDRS